MSRDIGVRRGCGITQEFSWLLAWGLGVLSHVVTHGFYGSSAGSREKCGPLRDTVSALLRFENAQTLKCVEKIRVTLLA